MIGIGYTLENPTQTFGSLKLMCLSNLKVSSLGSVMTGNKLWLNQHATLALQQQMHT